MMRLLWVDENIERLNERACGAFVGGLKMKATTKSLASYKWYRKSIDILYKKWKRKREPNPDKWYWVTFHHENDNVDREFVFRDVDDARAYMNGLRAAYPDALVAIVSNTGLMLY